jgi:DNA adenine methylase
MMLRGEADLQSPASEKMLNWQLRRLAGQLMLAQEHASDTSCPCEYSDEHEYCLVKHLIHIQSLAEETAAMAEDAKLKDILNGIAGAANDLRRAYEESSEDKRPYADIVQFARDARKAIEPYLFRYKQTAALKQEELRWCLPTVDLHMPAPFGWPGGKRQLAKKIVSLIPPHKTYVEPFAGAAWVFWAKEPSEIEVLNDIDPDLMRFYRDIGKIDHCNTKEISKDWDTLRHREGDVEACDFLTQVLCSYGRKREAGRPTSLSACQNDAPQFHKYLPQYQERLKKVKLHNEDWEKVVKQYDAPDTFFYFDPPYHNVKGIYKYGDDQLARLAEILPKLKGKWILSYNDDSEVREAFKDFYIQEVAFKYTLGKAKPELNKELLIANYPLQSAQLKQEEKMKTELKASITKFTPAECKRLNAASNYLTEATKELSQLLINKRLWKDKEVHSYHWDAYNDIQAAQGRLKRHKDLFCKREEETKTELKADPLLTEIASQLCTGGICFARGKRHGNPKIGGSSEMGYSNPRIGTMDYQELINYIAYQFCTFAEGFKVAEKDEVKKKYQELASFAHSILIQAKILPTKPSVDEVRECARKLGYILPKYGEFRDSSTEEYLIKEARQFPTSSHFLEWLRKQNLYEKYGLSLRDVSEIWQKAQEQKNPLPICSPSEAKALERCIAKVKAKQPKYCEKEWHKSPEEMREGCYNPYSVCRASVGCRLGGTEEYERKVA